VEKEKLRPLSQGLFCDDRGVLYVYLKDFLVRHAMPDRPDVWAALIRRIREEFGNVPIVVRDDAAP